MRSLSRCIDLARSATRAPVPCQRQERLHTAEDTQPQYIEIRPAEDDTGLSFQAVYLRFDLPLAPLRRKRGFNRCIIETNPVRHFFEFRKAAVFSLCEPGIQICTSALCQHHHKSLPQLIGHLQIKMARSDLLHRLALFLIELTRLTDEEPGCTCWGEATFDDRLGRQGRRNFENVCGSIECQD